MANSKPLNEDAQRTVYAILKAAALEIVGDGETAVEDLMQDFADAHKEETGSYAETFEKLAGIR